MIAVETSLPPHPCPAPPSPTTVILLATHAGRVVPLFHRSGGQRADSMMRRWDVRAGKVFLLSPCLPPARASVREVGVSGENHKWVVGA